MGLAQVRSVFTVVAFFSLGCGSVVKLNHMNNKSAAAERKLHVMHFTIQEINEQIAPLATQQVEHCSPRIS